VRGGMSKGRTGREQARRARAVVVMEGAAIGKSGEESVAILGGGLGLYLWAAGVARRGRFRFVGR